MPGSRMHMEHRPSTVQTALRVGLSWSPLFIAASNLQLLKIGADAFALRDFHSRLNVDAKTRRDVDDDVACRGLQPRVGKGAVAGRQLRYNCPATGLRPNAAMHRDHVDRSAAGLHLGGAAHIVQFNAAAARGGPDRPRTFSNVDGSAAGIELHIGAGPNHQSSTSRGGHDLPAGRADINGPATGLHMHVSAHLADPDVSPTTGDKDCAPIMVEMD